MVFITSKTSSIHITQIVSQETFDVPENFKIKCSIMRQPQNRKLNLAKINSVEKTNASQFDKRFRFENIESVFMTRNVGI